MAKYTKKQIEDIAIRTARKYGVDPSLVLAMIQQESGFRADAKSPAGAIGVMQLMPATAKELGVKNPYDPAQNIDAGVRYIKQQLKTFKGDKKKALAAYNAGAGNVQKYKGIPPFKETQNYVKNILAMEPKYRNSAASDSGTTTGAASLIGDNNMVKNDNNDVLEGRVSNTKISPTSSQGLKNILEGVESGTRRTEQRFRETINPQQKDALIKEMFANGFDPVTLTQYVQSGGSLDLLKISLQQVGVIGDKAPWEEGGQPITPRSEGLRRRQALEEIARQRASDELDLINQMNDPAARAEREQSMRDRLNSSFARYNQMVDSLQDPRLQNTGYYVNPDSIGKAASINALAAAFNGQPAKLMSPQELAQAEYEARIANQYGVPYQQVLDTQKANFDMKTQLLAAQIEAQYRQDLSMAQSDADILKAQQDRIKNFYDLQKEALKVESDYNDLTTKGYQDIVQAGVAPTISGSANIYTTGMGIAGDVLNKEVQGGVDLRLQAQKDREQAIRDKAKQETDLTIKSMELNNPFKQYESLGRGLEGYAATQGYNPQMINSTIQYTPFGPALYPQGVPPTNPNAINNNANGGLRIPTNNNLFNWMQGR